MGSDFDAPRPSGVDDGGDGALCGESDGTRLKGPRGTAAPDNPHLLSAEQFARRRKRLAADAYAKLNAAVRRGAFCSSLQAKVWCWGERQGEQHGWDKGTATFTRGRHYEAAQYRA